MFSRGSSCELSHDSSADIWLALENSGRLISSLMVFAAKKHLGGTAFWSVSFAR